MCTRHAACKKKSAGAGGDQKPVIEFVWPNTWCCLRTSGKVFLDTYMYSVASCSGGAYEIGESCCCAFHY